MFRATSIAASAAFIFTADSEDLLNLTPGLTPDQFGALLLLYEVLVCLAEGSVLHCNRSQLESTFSGRAETCSQIVFKPGPPAAEASEPLLKAYFRSSGLWSPCDSIHLFASATLSFSDI